MKKIFQIILIILVLILFWYLYHNYKLYIISSGSMEPTLKINELILVKKSKEYKVGDIISYYDESLQMPITHRITHIEGSRYYTKGDYNNIEDYITATPQTIIGKVIWNSYYLGSLYVHYKFILVVLLILVFLLINILPQKSYKERA